MSSLNGSKWIWRIYQSLRQLLRGWHDSDCLLISASRSETLFRIKKQSVILLGVKLTILLLLQEGITTVGLAENPQKQDIGTVNVVLTLMGFLIYIAPSCWTYSHIWKSEILHAQPAKYSWFNSIWTVIVVICEHCLAWICCFVHLVTLTPLIAHIIYCWMLFLVWFPCFVRSGCS